MCMRGIGHAHAWHRACACVASGMRVRGMGYGARGIGHGACACLEGKGRSPPRPTRPPPFARPCHSPTPAHRPSLAPCFPLAIRRLRHTVPSLAPSFPRRWPSYLSLTTSATGWLACPTMQGASPPLSEPEPAPEPSAFTPHVHTARSARPPRAHPAFTLFARAHTRPRSHPASTRTRACGSHGLARFTGASSSSQRRPGRASSARASARGCACPPPSHVSRA